MLQVETLNKIYRVKLILKWKWNIYYIKNIFEIKNIEYNNAFNFKLSTLFCINIFLKKIIKIKNLIYTIVMI